MNTLCKHCGEIIKIENFYYITGGEKTFIELYQKAEDIASNSCECRKEGEGNGLDKKEEMK